MSDIHTEPVPRPDRSGGRRDEFTLRIPKPRGGAVTRAALRTTEFWMTVALVVLVLVATYADDALGSADGWRFATWAVMAYVVSRGLAKLGKRADAVHDPAGPRR